MSPIGKEHIERFRSLVDKEYGFLKDKGKKSLTLEARVNGDRSIINVCEVKQSGEQVSRGEGVNSCGKALDDFEELVMEAR